MTALALVLVLIAAVLHATWNLCAKRAGGGLPFVWLTGLIICAGYVCSAWRSSRRWRMCWC